MINLLLVEDDLEFAMLIDTFLKSRNIITTTCDDPFKALVIDLNDFDLVLLDLGLPGIDGLEICKEFRKKSKIPIIISSARSSVTDKVSALQIGADDYLPKPYDPDEMYARIISLLRRTQDTFYEDVKEELFVIDSKTNDIKFDKNDLYLTQAEFEVFEYLLKNNEAVNSKEQILANCEAITSQDGKSLEMLISKIRHKIKKYSNEKHIISIRGRGYKIVK